MSSTLPKFIWPTKKRVEMNLALLNPFESEVPEQVEPIALKSKDAAICRWNFQGSHLAVGGDDGSLVVWDMQTRRIVRRLLGHAALITCISWSSDGSLLMSAAEDWNVILWNVFTGKKLMARQYSSPITMACLCPANRFVPGRF
jgi:WD40 repeat protein